MDILANRIKKYNNLSKKLYELSNAQLFVFLEKAENLHTGIGGKSVLLELDDSKIFVKQIPLTDIESITENIESTANLFALPFQYHIGVGSTGFGVWRELFVHNMATQWVISKECPNFPIMYHWRILPTSQAKPMNAEQLESLERDVQYWDNDPAVRKRLEAIYNASAHVYLFLEYVPQTLFKWLENKLAVGGDTAATAITFVDNQLRETNKFINDHGLLHFDAHFENILADEDNLYFSDFGLSLCSKFEMSKDEITLFDQYKSYDQCSSITNFLHCIISCLYGKDAWELKLSDYINGNLKNLEPAIEHIVKRYAEIGLTMDEFFQKMQKISKSTPYPAKQLEKLLDSLEPKNNVI